MNPVPFSKSLLCAVLAAGALLSAGWSVNADHSPGGRVPFRERIRQRLLERFDANRNGVLDPQERAAARQAFQEWLGSPAGQGPGSRRQAVRKKILEKFDTNHNGRLDPEERQALKQAIRARLGSPASQHGAGNLQPAPAPPAQAKPGSGNSPL